MAFNATDIHFEFRNFAQLIVTNVAVAKVVDGLVNLNVEAVTERFDGRPLIGMLAKLQAVAARSLSH